MAITANIQLMDGLAMIGEIDSCCGPVPSKMVGLVGQRSGTEKGFA
jgi:hypothetical protein